MRRQRKCGFFCIIWPVLTSPGQAWLVGTLLWFSHHLYPPHRLLTFWRNQLRCNAIMETHTRLCPLSRILLRVPSYLSIIVLTKCGIWLASCSFTRPEAPWGADSASIWFAPLPPVSRTQTAMESLDTVFLGRHLTCLFNMLSLFLGLLGFNSRLRDLVERSQAVELDTAEFKLSCYILVARI